MTTVTHTVVMSLEQRNAPPGFETVDSVANALGVRRQTVLRWARSGDLPSIKLGRTVFVASDAFDRLLDESRATALNDGRSRHAGSSCSGTGSRGGMQ